ncbi:histone-lysine N-methyltransferase 2A-like [Pollicipes pollicipes]|uniref:histone-lysine N-methyltransferase 2A-like n=1 Tax=Pollicipes pollicipes TaxID=41117 RepID=UPI0018854176|nr:histone-lysine N-methyltransferase 2A-like [Pollicipes pollicipes]
MTRSSRVVRPSRRFVEDNALLGSGPPASALAPEPAPAQVPARPPRAARALSPTSDQELDEGVIKTVVEYADSMAAAPGRGAAVAPPPAAEPPPAAQSDIEAMLRAQWDGRLKVRGREEEAAAAPGRHLLRQPRLQLNNRVLKRLRDGRDLTYLSEQEEAPAEPAEDAAAAAGSGGSPAAPTSGGGYVTCGPCGSRRYVAVPSLCYKFGSWICLHCIKFVLKMLKQNAPAPKCLDDKDACRVLRDEAEQEQPPPPPDSRCDVCWLKACLNALNFSEERHNRLRSSLPRAQQAGVPLFSRKRRLETGCCEYGPLRPAAALAPAPAPAAPPAAPPTPCRDKAWGGTSSPDPVGFEELSRPAVAAAAATAAPATTSTTVLAPASTSAPTSTTAPVTPPTSTSTSTPASTPVAAAVPVSTPAAALARAGGRSGDRPPAPGAHSRKAVTSIPLGGGWKRREFVRKGGRLDRVVCAPDGTRFKSVVELQAYLRTTDITRKAKSFFMDGPPPPAPPPAAAAAASPEPAGAELVRLGPGHVRSDLVVRDSFVKRGPRVKLVCRSASLVLGQPRATFGDPLASAAEPAEPSPPPPPSAGKENRTQATAAARDGWATVRRHGVTVKKLKKRRHAGADDKPSSRNVLMKLKVLHKYKHLQQSRGKERIRKSRCGTCLGCRAKNCTKCVFCKDMIKYGGPGRLKKSCARRVCKKPLLPGVNVLKLGEEDDPAPSEAATAAAASEERPTEADTPGTTPAQARLRRPSPLVQLDHWSPRDPAELWESGLAVLAAQPPGVPVLCFVCASAGKEEMLYCNSCCEPYHPFCLEEGDVPRSALHQENWVCRRCQVCCVCGAAPPDDPLHRCHQCNETYHLACLGPHACAAPGRADQPWTCVRCTRCRSCQKTEIHQYVGNLPLCRNCFQLHQRGNYCPLCGGCYEDDDYDTKMMECESCHTWVHAHCENLSEEMYQILSFLPESVSYLCDRCLPEPPAPGVCHTGLAPEQRRSFVADISWRRAVRDEFESGCSAVIRAVWSCLSRRATGAAETGAPAAAVTTTAAETGDYDGRAVTPIKPGVAHPDHPYAAGAAAGPTPALMTSPTEVRARASPTKYPRTPLKRLAAAAGSHEQFRPLIDLCNRHYQALRALFEEVDGSLRAVRAALHRGRQTRCVVCLERGATRRVFIEPEALRRRPAAAALDTVTAVVGSLTIHSFGERVVSSSSSRYLLPVGMSCSRVYWSTINPRRRTVYTVRTVSTGPPPPSDVHCVVDHSLDREQVRACLESLLNQVCRSVVEEEETLLAEANLNIPILENVDNDFLTLMLNELCEGEGATYLGEAAGMDAECAGPDMAGACCAVSEAMGAARDADGRGEPGADGKTESEKVAEIAESLEQLGQGPAEQQVSSSHLQMSPPPPPPPPPPSSSLPVFTDSLSAEQASYEELMAFKPVATVMPEPRDQLAWPAELRTYSAQLSQLDGAGDESDDEALPSKCPKCRRMYRTRESMLKHQDLCDFEVDSSGSSEAEEEAAEGAAQVAEPRRAFVEPGEAVPEPAATGEAEVSSTTAPLPPEPDRPKLEIKQEAEEALLMIGNQLVSPGHMLMPQVQPQGVVIVQGNVSYTVLPAQHEPVLYGQPAPFLLNYPQLALPPGANLQHLGSFELGPAAGQLPQPVVYSMAGLTPAGGLVTSMPSPELPVAGSRHVYLVKPSTVVAPAGSSDCRKVAKVKPRPTYSYRDAMKTNPMLQQEKGKLMRRLVPLDVDSTSGRAAGGEARETAAPPSPAPSVSSSGPAGAEPDDPLKLSYRIKLRRERADDGFQVREIVRSPAGEPASPGGALRSVKITARVGSLGSDVLVVPRQQRADAEVEVRGDRDPDLDDADKENRARPDEPADAGDPAVVYEVTSADGLQFRSPDIAEVWRRVFEAVQDARTGMKMKPLTYNARSVSGQQMLGLTHDAIQFLLEQMPGAEDCTKHSFRFHKPEFGPLRENPFGCARAEGFKQRKPIDMFSWLASKHRQLPEPSGASQPPPPTKLSRRGSSLELPMAMRYRQLCESTRDLVGVYRSSISGRGLFCKRTVEAGQMVIEYAGQVIRSSLTDIRERYYSSRGIGCYMFKIDDDFVVDATMKGNAARFINHSCNPNCYSRVVDILGKKHIIIFALRKISRGEELTYDYKFPIEEDKIPCTCGARRCRKYLN